MLKIRPRASLAGKAAPQDRRGQNSLSMRGKADRMSSESAMMPTGMNATNISSNAISIDTGPMMEGLSHSDEHSKALYPIYRDMYYNDPVCGATVDLISTMPFGDFTLGGAPVKVMRPYNDTVERLGVKSLLSEIGVDYMVLGSNTGSLLYNRQKRMFVDLMPHSPEDCEIITLPFYSQEPIINVAFGPDVKKALQSGSKRIEKLRNLVGDEVFKQILSGKLELDPLSTIYIPRKTMTGTDLGTSYLRRVLPMYLIEKNLYRGTLMESARRQRGILHLVLGDGENWIPSPADMDFMTELFMNADNDPLGAVIATQEGIQVNELRQGGEFWKYTDYADSVLSSKLRALGVSEGFLSGDATFSNQDTALAVFLKMLGTFRSMITRKFFYDRLFPLISLVEGNYITASGKLGRDEGLINRLGTEDAMDMLSDGSRLFIPTVTWSKKLESEGDQPLYELLSGLSEKGIPAPIRMLAAAAGVNIEDLMKMKDEDLKMRMDLADWQKKIAAITAPEGGESEGDAEQEMSESSAIAAVLSADPLGKTRSAVHAEGGRINLLDRKFGDLAEIRGETKTGRPKYIIGQRRAQDRANHLIAKSVSAARKKNPGITHQFNVPLRKQK